MPMSTSQPAFSSLTLAAYGWSPANWQAMFYPDDLPPDWQTSYYANEFIRILLPASDWEASLAKAALWAAETGQDFGFYLEITTSLLQARHWQQVKAGADMHLSSQVLGLLVDAEALPLLPLDWSERFPVHVRHLGQWLAAMPSGAEAQIGLLQATQAFSPPALREVFEEIQQQTAHRDVILFLDTPWATLEQLRLMQQLYGV
ncbi:hypothetical protein J9253_06270 [Thiothrix litoralis]|uniref:DUF72 domain-containing protein n=1 Tax=Thiothrix litoralis TaxID=2891210 RepID=A0ABX7WW75_9GAMM|nr:hypothetical protein [Thiothrix litoralis]QTR47536.1 hypothetical protein J9253_06270 [Thiothrix litoralis]